MAFNPLSTIRLCNVPFDSSYKNVVYFEDEVTQYTYFANKTVKTFANYVTVRETLPDGTFQSSVKVEANIDSLRYAGVNYMMYQNAQSSSKYFYAFITKMIYVNEDTTKLIFETDVYQTWRFEAEVLDSYVEREHSKTDKIGDNLVPEKFEVHDWSYKKAYLDDTLGAWGYLIATSNPHPDDKDEGRGRMINGIYQGLYFYYKNIESPNVINDFLDAVEEAEGEAIQFIALIPAACVDQQHVTATGLIKSNYSATERSFVINFNPEVRSLEGYFPDNNKLLTSPFLNLVVSNHNGDEAVYNVEEFEDSDNMKFVMFGDVSANPTVTLVPQNYKYTSLTTDDHYDFGISIGGFPQCSVNTDTFKLWLAKNQFSVGQNLSNHGGSILAGMNMIGGFGGTALALAGGAPLAAAAGVAAITAGINGVFSSMNSVYQASRQPNSIINGNAKNNLLTAMEMNKFDFYWRTLRYDYAQSIDNFFTMYGYQTNKVKKPNLNSRPYYNYVKTIGVNIVGGIPNDDMIRLKTIYDNGVTLWKPNATIGDYSKSQDNRVDKLGV